MLLRGQDACSVHAVLSAKLANGCFEAGASDVHVQHSGIDAMPHMPNDTTYFPLLSSEMAGNGVEEDPCTCLMSITFQ